MHLVVGIMGVFGGSHEVRGLGGMGYDVIGQPLPQHCCQGYQPLLSYSISGLECCTVLVVKVNSIKVIGKHIVGQIVGTCGWIVSCRSGVLCCSEGTHHQFDPL